MSIILAINSINPDLSFPDPLTLINLDFIPNWLKVTVIILDFAAVFTLSYFFSFLLLCSWIFELKSKAIKIFFLTICLPIAFVFLLLGALICLMLQFLTVFGTYYVMSYLIQLILFAAWLCIICIILLLKVDLSIHVNFYADYKWLIAYIPFLLAIIAVFVVTRVILRLLWLLAQERLYTAITIFSVTLAILTIYWQVTVYIDKFTG